MDTYYHYANKGFGIGGQRTGVRQSVNMIMKVALPLPRPNSISNCSVQLPKRHLTNIKNNICGFKKWHYMQRLVFHGKLSVRAGNRSCTLEKL